MSDGDPSKKPSEPEEMPISVGLQWEKIDDSPTIYANQLLITHSGPEFYLVFGEVVPLTALNPEDIPKTLSVKPRVKVAVSYQAMQAFVAVINDNFGKFMEKVERATKQHDNAKHAS